MDKQVHEIGVMHSLNHVVNTMKWVFFFLQSLPSNISFLSPLDSLG